MWCGSWRPSTCGKSGAGRARPSRLASPRCLEGDATGASLAREVCAGSPRPRGECGCCSTGAALIKTKWERTSLLLFCRVRSGFPEPPLGSRLPGGRRVQAACALVRLFPRSCSFIREALRALSLSRCKTCGEYIYKGKKFNARKETVQNEMYLGLPIFRFYIKCTRCLAEITFKVRPLGRCVSSGLVAGYTGEIGGVGRYPF